MLKRLLVVAACASVVHVSHASTRQATLSSDGSRFLFVWSGDADQKESDFLAVVDANPASAKYGDVVTTLPVGAVGTRPHHTEYEMPASGILWANGFDGGRTFLFDLRNPLRPVLQRSFTDTQAFSHPHSYARLPNGHILATFQWADAAHDHAAAHRTGGLIEFDPDGRIVRTASAAAPSIDDGIKPYSLVVVPAIDRIVTTASDMHLESRSRAIQVWRLSDLTLLQTLLLPPGTRGDENALSAEPRLLADGRTVLVNTFTCGLYRVNGLASATATAEWIYSTRWDPSQGKRFCAVPVVAGRFWIQTSGAEHAIVTLDVSDPARPREMSRLSLGPRDEPHWIALEPNGERIVITGYDGLEHRVLIARLDRKTGVLRIDDAFKSVGSDRPGVDFGRTQWPHGPSGAAIPHGAVFSQPVSGGVM